MFLTRRWSYKFFPRFLVAGVLNTLGTTVIIGFCYWILGSQIGIWASTLLGYSVAVVAAFFLSSRWVFRVTGTYRFQFPLFLLVQGISGIGIASIASLLFSNLGLPAPISHFLAVGLLLPMSFLGQQWVFHHHGTSESKNADS